MVHDVSRREKVDLDLLKRFHDGHDLQAREELAARCVPLVRSIVRRYVGRGEETDDLVQAGMLGLVKAIDRFDASTGHRFISFAVPNITGEIRRHFRDHTWDVHVPRSVQELDARVQKTRTAVVERTGHEPTVVELARACDVTTDEIRDAQMAGRAYNAASLDAPSGEDRTVVDLRGGPDRGYALVEDEDLIARAMVGLSDRERKVIDWRFRGGLLQREIAERVGVSQMQVSRILRAAVARMGETAAGPGLPVPDAADGPHAIAA